MTPNQNKVVELMSQLPEDLTPEEFEAMITSLVAWYTSEEQVPGFLGYLSVKVSMMYQRMVEKETKH
jgi:hypothetical protein